MTLNEPVAEGEYTFCIWQFLLKNPDHKKFNASLTQNILETEVQSITSQETYEAAAAIFQ